MNQTSSQIFESRPHGLGELLALTLQFFVRNIGPVLGITLVVLGPIALIGMVNSSLSIINMPASFARQSNPDQSMTGTQVLISIVSGCSSLIVFVLSFLQPWMEGALTHNLIERLLGREPAVGDSYRAVRPRFWSLWGSTVLAQIIIAVPLIIVYVAAVSALIGLFVGMAGPSGDNGSSVFAGVMLAVCAPLMAIAGIVFSLLMTINFLFRTPVIVAEGADGIQALGRSNKLASGHRWLLFLRMAVLYLLKAIFILGPSIVISGMLIWVAFGAAGSGQAPELSSGMIALLIVLLLFALVVQLVLTPIGVIFVAFNYLDMRVRNENLVLQMAGVPSNTPIQPVSVQPMPSSYLPPTSAVIPVTPSAPVAPSAYPGLSPTASSPGQKIGLLFNRIRVEGQSADLLNDLGLAYMDVGDFGGALDAFTRARQLNPNDADIAYNMMLLHLNRKDTPAARSTMQDYLRLENNAEDRERVVNNPKFKELL